MPDQAHNLDDEELRAEIRAEIEQRDRERSKERQQREEQRNANELAERKRRIYSEEMHRYYLNRPGYKKVIREDGEPDWIPIEQEAEEQELFDEVMEDPIDARKKQRGIFLITVLIIVAASVIIYLLLHEGKGTIQIYCNVPDARVIMDATPTQSLTAAGGDSGFTAILKEVPSGQHLITVDKPGYVVDGESIQKVEIRGGENKIITFVLVPQSQTGTNEIPEKPPVSEGMKDS